MRVKAVGGAVVLAAAALGAFAAIGLGKDGAGTPARAVHRAAAPKQLAGHEVAVPSGGATTRGKSGKKTKFRYVESQAITLNAGVNEHDGGFLRCPKKNLAISGYFVANKPGATLDYSAVGVDNIRDWVFDAYNTDAEAHSVLFGVVCAK